MTSTRGEEGGQGQGGSFLSLISSAPPQYPLNSSREERIEILKRHVVSKLETWQIKRRVKEEIIRQGQSTKSPRDFREGSKALSEIETILDSAGLLVKLKNLVYEANRAALNNAPAPPDGLTHSQCFTADKLDYVERAKLKWEKRIRQELDAMAAELEVPLQRPRKEEPPKVQPEDQPIRFVYDDNDLLDVLCNISNPNHVVSSVSRIPSWGQIKAELEVQDLERLKETFKEMEPAQRHLGVDDELRPQLVEERTRSLQRALNIGYIPLLRQLAKKGIPQALRSSVWRKILDVHVSDKDVLYLESIHANLRQWELVTDDLFRLDVSITSNDDNYFVFEETLADTMSAFSRDPWLCNNTVVFSQANDKHYPDVQVREGIVFPPCGIVPFRGIVMYATPFCYLYSDTALLYYTFRACYANYCCRLHTVSSNTGDILQLARQFESILQETNAELFYHLLNIGSPPLKIAFNWIVFGFAGYLEPDQILALWDRVLAWDSLTIVPVVAAAIFSYREQKLLECNTFEEVQDVLSEASKVKVIILLQLYLFRDSVERLQRAVVQ